MRFKLPRFTRNFYFFSGMFFLVWILFIDSNDLLTQIKLQSKINKLEDQKEYYQNNIQEISEQFDQRENDMELIEKFAREKYLMKKETEDLFIIVEEE